MATSKMFRLANGVDMHKVGKYVESILKMEKQMETSASYSNEGIFIQGQQRSDGWKKMAGMDMATQIQIIPSGENISVNIGQGKWSDKVGAGTIGVLLSIAPLAVTSGIGAIMQGKLPTEIFDKIEKFILSGGQMVTVDLGAVAALNANEVLCPKCKTANDKSNACCMSCGTQLSLTCPKCGLAVPLGIKFCTGCGSNIADEIVNSSLIKCTACGGEIAKNLKFCPLCGEKVIPTNQTVCSKCGISLKDGVKFCPECGGKATAKAENVCSVCGIHLDENVKFCPECGGKSTFNQ